MQFELKLPCESYRSIQPGESITPDVGRFSSSRRAIDTFGWAFPISVQMDEDSIAVNPALTLLTVERMRGADRRLNDWLPYKEPPGSTESGALADAVEQGEASPTSDDE